MADDGPSVEDLKQAAEEKDGDKLKSETVYAKKKELTEEEKADKLEKEERELGEFQADGMRQALFILLDEPESGPAAKLMSMVLMAIIFCSCVTFIIETHPSIACKGFEDPLHPHLCLTAFSDDNGAFDPKCVRTDEIGTCVDGCNVTVVNNACSCIIAPECATGDCGDGSSMTQLCTADEEGTASQNAEWAYNTRWKMHIFETMCIISFTVEWLARTFTCTARPRTDQRFLPYFLKPLNLIDIVAIAPWYLEKFSSAGGSLSILRILRMTRIFRVVKAGGSLGELQLFIEGYKRAREGLLLLAFLLFLYLCVFAAILYICEYDAKTVDCFSSCMVDDLGNDLELDGRVGSEICFFDIPGDGPHLNGTVVVASDTYDEVDWPYGLGTYPGPIGRACDECGCSTRGFTSIPTTWYFIMATMTTVGYGDHYPLTVGGRITCGFCMLAGIMVLALPIIVIGNAFEEVFAEEKRHKAEKSRRLALKKLERELQNGTASEETQAKMDAINAEAKAQSESFLDITTCVHFTSTVLEKLKTDTDDPRFAKALAEVLKD